MLIPIACIDPAITNTGVAQGFFDTDKWEITYQHIDLIVTKSNSSKTIKQNADDLFRAMQIIGWLNLKLSRAKIVIAEIPVGSQSARAAFCLGMATAIVASIPECLQKPLVQVQPKDRGLASIGRKFVSKEEIIEWAVNKYPHLEWHRKGKEAKLLGCNEHMADACAIGLAGIKTAEFRKTVSWIIKDN